MRHSALHQRDGRHQRVSIDNEALQRLRITTSALDVCVQQPRFDRWKRRPANIIIHRFEERRQVRLDLIEWCTRLKRDAGAQDVEGASIQGRRQTTYERSEE